MKETMMNEAMELTMDDLEQVNGGCSDNIFKKLWEKYINTPNPNPMLPPDSPRGIKRVLDEEIEYDGPLYYEPVYYKL